MRAEAVNIILSEAEIVKRKIDFLRQEKVLDYINGFNIGGSALVSVVSLVAEAPPTLTEAGLGAFVLSVVVSKVLARTEHQRALILDQHIKDAAEFQHASNIGLRNITPPIDLLV